MMKRITAILFALVLIFSVALLPASAAGEPASYSYRFDDNADLLTDAEEQALKETLYDVCSKCGCNIVFFTANDLNGATFSHTGTAQDYTQRYYETCCGVNTDGVVCGLVLRDEDGDRQVLLYGSGKCVKRLSDSECPPAPEMVYAPLSASDRLRHRHDYHVDLQEAAQERQDGTRRSQLRPPGQHERHRVARHLSVQHRIPYRPSERKLVLRLKPQFRRRLLQRRRFQVLINVYQKKVKLSIF